MSPIDTQYLTFDFIINNILFGSLQDLNFGSTGKYYHTAVMIIL